MSKKYYRFLGGLLNTQMKWLNSIVQERLSPYTQQKKSYMNSSHVAPTR